MLADSAITAHDMGRVAQSVAVSRH